MIDAAQVGWIGGTHKWRWSGWCFISVRGRELRSAVFRSLSSRL